MLLGAKLAKILQYDDILYCTDNQTLATTLEQENPIDNPGDWTLRPSLFQFQNMNAGINHRIRKIDSVGR